MTKFIFVTGGVLSSLGKGITSASIATILKQSGFKVSMLKIDPYLNVDPGTMSPLEHGEVFVTADGAETDLDLGNYERFIDKTLTKKNSFTTGQVYQSVIKREREGGYLGKTIQVIPHVVDEIKERIYAVTEDNDFLIIELGGTVGDIEGLPFMEAIRSIRHELPKSNTMNIHLSLVPYIRAAGELKTKPTQHSVQELRRIGITPHMLVCRTERELPKSLKDKLALACDIDRNAVIEAGDAQSIYQVPLQFIKEGILTPLSEHFNIPISGLKGKKRNAEIVLPRQIIMYLCRTLTDTPLKAIGAILGGKDHASVNHGVKKIENELKTDEALNNTVNIIKKKINPI